MRANTLRRISLGWAKEAVFAGWILLEEETERGEPASAAEGGEW